MRATIEVHRFFSEAPQFGSSSPLPKADLEENKTATTPEEKAHGLGA